MSVSSQAKQQAAREWRRGAADLPRPNEKSAKTVVEKLLPKLGLEQQVRQSELLADWVKIVGQDNAKHSRPATFRNGILTVAVDHSAWRMEFEHQKALWVRKVRDYLKPTAVKDIVFRVEG